MQVDRFPQSLKFVQKRVVLWKRGKVVKLSQKKLVRHVDGVKEPAAGPGGRCPVQFACDIRALRHGSFLDALHGRRLSLMYEQLGFMLRRGT